MKEYLEALREALGERYLKASRKERGQILDEVKRVTGYYRKAVIRLLRRGWNSDAVDRRGRAKQYGTDAVAALKVAWEASDRMCSRRLQPFLPELVAALECHGELDVTEGVKDQLCRMSASTIDRALKPHRHRG